MRMKKAKRLNAFPLDAARRAWYAQQKLRRRDARAGTGAQAAHQTRLHAKPIVSDGCMEVRPSLTAIGLARGPMKNERSRAS